MTPAEHFFLRPATVMLSVLLLCSSAGWTVVGAETTSKKKEKAAAAEEEESTKKSTGTKNNSGSGSKTPASTSSSTGSKSSTSEKPATTTSSKSGSKSSKGSTSTTTAAKQTEESKPKPKSEPEPASKPKVVAKVDPPKKTDKEKEEGSNSKTDDKTVKPETKSEPAKPSEPKDVTSTSKATTREMDPKEKPDSEFGHETEADKKAKSEAAQGSKTAAVTTSSDISGWEILHYQGADYVTASSVHRFYRFHNLERDGNRVSFTSPVLVMRATIGSQDLLINNIKFVMNDPVLELNGKPCFSRLDLCKLIDPVLRPSYINTSSGFDTVVIDPGHGGHDSGARGIYGYEKDFALKLAFALKSQLEAQGIRVVMTRTTDTFISLGGRVQFANKIPNSIYVSLHFNSGPSTGTGIETFALTPQGASSVYGARTVDAHAFNGNQRDSENIALATAIHASVVNHFKLVDRGVKRARWYVLKGLERPGVLFEGGFVTSPVDGRLIAADNFRREMAATLCQAIMNYKRALRPSGVRPMGTR